MTPTEQLTTYDFGGFKIGLPTKADIHIEHIDNIYDNKTVISASYDISGDKDIYIEYYEYGNKIPPYTSTNYQLDYDKNLDEWYAVIFDTTNHKCIKISCSDDKLLQQVCKSFEFQNINETTNKTVNNTVEKNIK